VVSEIIEDLDRWKLVLPKEWRKKASRESHDTPQAGHLRIEKIYQRITINYFWPNLFRDVTIFGRAMLVSVLKPNKRVPRISWDITSRTDQGP